MVNAFPAVSLIAETHPNADIHWVVAEPFAPILSYHAAVSKRVVFPRRNFFSPVGGFAVARSFLAGLRAGDYDLVIDFQGLMRSAAIARWAASSKVAGFASPKERICRWGYHRRVEVPENLHAVEKNWRLAAGAVDIPPPGAARWFPWPAITENVNSAERGLERKGVALDASLIALVPGARWPTKKWPSSFFRRVVKLVTDGVESVRFVILGDRADVETGEEILGDDLRERVVSLAGETRLGEMVEILRRCRLLLTNDSGPMHVAAALNVPVFALFGPTRPDWTGPYGSGHVVFQSDLDCIHCLKRYCPKGDSGVECHERIDAEDVAAAIIKKVLSS